MAHRVVAVAIPGLVTFDLTCALQVLGHSASADGSAGLYAVDVCSPGGTTVATDDGVGLIVEHDLDALEAADTVLVPGYRAAPHAAPGDDVLAALRRASARGARMASICVGAFALGHAGLLDGRRATTHWAAVELLGAQFPAATVQSDVLYVDDGDLLTSAGLASGLDLALHLVRRDHGAQAAVELARWNVVAPHRDGAQAQFISTAMPDAGDTSLAARANLSERTLLRRFGSEIGTSPRQWLLRARLDRARQLLETTDLPVEDVARRSGFPAAAALRARFSAVLGTTPSAYRRAFAPTR